MIKRAVLKHKDEHVLDPVCHAAGCRREFGDSRLKSHALSVWAGADSQPR
jgi:hypothetical protein